MNGHTAPGVKTKTCPVHREPGEMINYYITCIDFGLKEFLLIYKFR